MLYIIAAKHALYKAIAKRTRFEVGKSFNTLFSVFILLLYRSRFFKLTAEATESGSQGSSSSCRQSSKGT